MIYWVHVWCAHIWFNMTCLQSVHGVPCGIVVKCKTHNLKATQDPQSILYDCTWSRHSRTLAWYWVNPGHTGIWELSQLYDWNNVEIGIKHLSHNLSEMIYAHGWFCIPGSGSVQPDIFMIRVLSELLWSLTVRRCPSGCTSDVRPSVSPQFFLLTLLHLQIVTN